jgi:uncharacterized UPF0160 family protein
MIVVKTNDGFFRAAEVFSVAMLKTLYEEKEKNGIRVNRNRNPKDTNYDYIINTDRKYDGEKYFDSKAEGVPTREDGSKYSSAGLLWKALGEKRYGKDIYEYIDKKYVVQIDCYDNYELKGFSGLHISKTIDQLNPTSIELKKKESQKDSQKSYINYFFFNAVDIAFNIFNRWIMEAKSHFMDARMIENCISNTIVNEQAVVFEDYCNFKDYVTKMKDRGFKYAIYPDQFGSGWRVKCIDGELPNTLVNNKKVKFVNKKMNVFGIESPTDGIEVLNGLSFES